MSASVVFFFCVMMMIRVSVSAEWDVNSSAMTHSHCRLLAEPLLAGSAVVDVLQHVAQHGPLPPLFLSHSLDALVHPGT